MVQIYVVKSVFDGLSQEDKTKFATSGQEVTKILYIKNNVLPLQKI